MCLCCSYDVAVVHRHFHIKAVGRVGSYLWDSHETKTGTELTVFSFKYSDIIFSSLVKFVLLSS